MIANRLFSSRGTQDVKPGLWSSMARLLRMPLAGVMVDEHKALQFSAVWACIRIISESIAVLPWGAFQQDGDKRTVASKHKVHRLLNRQPNSEMTPYVFKRTIAAHAVSWGNGYAEIERNVLGEPIALWIITPNRVQPDRDQAGKLVYKVAQPDGSTVIIPARDMFHVPGLGFDGIQGYSVLTMARESIALGMAAEQFGAAFFGNGATPAMVITHREGSTTKALSQDGARNLISSFYKRNGGPAKGGKLNYLDPGMDVKAVGIPQKDAQFLEGRKFQILEICRWFRVPPHKLAELDRATFSNIESQNLEFVNDTLLPWIIAMEQEADAKLFRMSEDGFYTKMNLNMYLRGDTAARLAFYSGMFDRGVYSIDDIRAREDENPLPNGIGKLRMVPMNFVSVENAFNAGGTGAGGDPAKRDRSTKALWKDIAQRMVTKEVKALERIVARADAATEARRFYQAQCDHIAESFSTIAIHDGVADMRGRAQTYCQESVAQVESALADGTIDDLFASWRFRRAGDLTTAMGCPYV